jgi:hypothetical protein
MKQVDFIICDDVRMEVGNKVSLMGIYDDQIFFAQPGPAEQIWPRPMRTGIYIKAELEGKEVMPETFQIWCQNKEGSVLLLNGDVNKGAPNSRRLVLAMTHPMVAFTEGVNELRVQFRGSSEKELAVLTKQVTAGIVGQ